MQNRMCFPSPLGEITALSNGSALTALYLPGQGPGDAALAAISTPCGSDPVLLQTRAWLAAYFSGRNPAPDDVPLAPRGTPFQHAVWALLREIPYGTSTTYGALAARIAAQRGILRMAAQAVGGAVGRNPIAILIPCHRVLGADGSLTGYAGGLDKKIALLTLENIPYHAARTAPESEAM